MDEILKIKCPFCGSKLSVKNIQGIEKKYVTCPVCKNKYLFTQYKIINNKVNRGYNDPYMEHLGTSELTIPFRGVQSENIISNKKDQMIGRLHLVGTNVYFQLKNGTNIIGRHSKSPNADFLIDTGNKRLMSRQHLRIDVVSVNGCIIHRLSLFKPNVNKTSLNNQEIVYGDCLILSEGDVINLPDATLKFEMQDNELTQLF